LTFIYPCIASISLKYSQQDATFPPSIYFYKLLYIFQAVPSPIIRNTKLYIQRQVLSNLYCCLLLSWKRWNSCLSVVSVVCCQVEVFATSWSLVQRSLTDCGVWFRNLVKEEAMAHWGLLHQKQTNNNILSSPQLSAFLHLLPNSPATATATTIMLQRCVPTIISFLATV
jgi:hypothetical protein